MFKETAEERRARIYPVILSTALKIRLHKEFEHDRDEYTRAKSEFIRAVTERARKLCSQ